MARNNSNILGELINDRRGQRTWLPRPNLNEVDTDTSHLNGNMLTQLMPALKAVAPLALLVLPFALLDRKREVDRQGNPTLVPLSVSVMLCLGGVLCLWGGVQALHDRTACPGDISAQLSFGTSAAAFLLAGLSYHAKVTLYGDRIERRRLPFWKSIYPLDTLVEVTDGRGGPQVLKFSDGRKIVLSQMQSGRRYFIERLRAFAPGAFDVVETRWADKWARTRQMGRNRFLARKVLIDGVGTAALMAIVFWLGKPGVYDPAKGLLGWFILFLVTLPVAVFYRGQRFWRDEEQRFREYHGDAGR